MLFFANSLTIPLAISILLAVLVGMTIHEFAHNYVAYLMGDPTPKTEGRLTLDPSVHIYWPGFIMFVLIGFGILGTAPVAAGRMRNPRWGYLAAVAAGPFSNLLIAIVAGLIFRLIPLNILVDMNAGQLTAIGQLLRMMVLFNVLLFIINILPLYPLDGWHIVFTLLPPDQAYWWQRNAMITQYVFLGLILLEFFPLLPFGPLSFLIGGPINAINSILLGG